MEVSAVHGSRCCCRDLLIIHGFSAPGGFALFLFPRIQLGETAVVVVAQTSEVVEGDHLQVNSGKSVRQLLKYNWSQAKCATAQRTSNGSRPSGTATDGCFPPGHQLPNRGCRSKGLDGMAISPGGVAFSYHALTQNPESKGDFFWGSHARPEAGVCTKYNRDATIPYQDT